MNELIDIVREAGAIALEHKVRGLNHGLKGDGSSISDADLAVDHFLKQHLINHFNAAWLSEETADNNDRLNAEWLWVVDPIDGTRSYIKGDTDWAVSVALLHRQKPVKAVLYRPDLGDLFVAEKNKGAKKNNQPLTIVSENQLAKMKVTGPHPFIKHYLDQGMHAADKIHALALRIAAVSDGTLNVALASNNAHDWDIAAADLIVEEAGGILRYTSGLDIAYNKISPKHQTMVAGHFDTLKRITHA